MRIDDRCPRCYYFSKLSQVLKIVAEEGGGAGKARCYSCASRHSHPASGRRISGAVSMAIKCYFGGVW